jgi:hypothetical protein
MKLPNLTNFDDHPTEPGWIVFRFPTAAQASEFIQELEKNGLRCEQDNSEGPPFLVAAKQYQREAAIRANYRVLGRHRKPFLGDPTLRWAVITLFALLLSLALIGALIKP